MVSEPFQVVTAQNEEPKDVYMMTDTEKVYVKLNNSASVSKKLDTKTFEAGKKDSFQLSRKNNLFEFGYSTFPYLANKHESIYTRVTLISPLYIVVNHTNHTLLVA
jgi:hypothetical protein